MSRGSRDMNRTMIWITIGFLGRLSPIKYESMAAARVRATDMYIRFFKLLGFLDLALADERHRIDANLNTILRFISNLPRPLRSS